MFIGLWMMADREGRLEDRPKRIAAEIFPYSDKIEGAAVDLMLTDLDRYGFIIRYAVDEKKYIQIVEWKKHQHPHPKETTSVIPKPTKLTKGLPKVDLGLSQGSTQEHTQGSTQEHTQGSTFSALPDPNSNSPALHAPVSATASAANAAQPQSQTQDPPTDSQKTTTGARERISATGYDALSGWKWFAENYRGVLNPDGDCRLWISIVESQAVEDKIRADIADRMTDPDSSWQRDGGRYIPKAKTYLSERQFNEQRNKTAAAPATETHEQRAKRMGLHIPRKSTPEELEKARLESPIFHARKKTNPNT